MAERLGVTVLGVSLKAEIEFPAEVGGLGRRWVTRGLDVVWWQQVEPVGLMLGGNLDL